MLLLAAGLCLGAAAPSAQYAGPEACAKCHKEIAATQSVTRMAKTWKGASALSLPATFDQKRTEGDPALQYEVRRVGNAFQFSVVTPFGVKSLLPVEEIIGGDRHGISFLTRIREVGSIKLERPALLESRYAYSPRGSLVLSPGFGKEKPDNLEDSLGRVLSPNFERRCLTCHGQPDTLGAGLHGGVRCESCHGPSASHVESMQPGSQTQAPALPEKLTPAKSIEVCAQCHTGLSAVNHADPIPGDLLVSSQVPALRNSECFKQSGGAISCTDCHDPHRDFVGVAERSVTTCLQCHSVNGTQHAAICPINQTSGCISCHMASVDANGFRLTDHWIGVHPEQGVKAAKQDDALRSLVAPQSEYLEILVTDTRAQAEVACARLAKGDSFYDVAHDLSIDPTAPGGGFVREMHLSEMDSQLASAAAKLPYGGTSGVIEQGSRFVMLHRLPRDFKWQADQLYEQAVASRNRGDKKAAMEQDRAALKVYPYFLRALVFMGSLMGEAGNAAGASDVLQFAAQSYPEDAATQFDLGLALGSQPSAQIEVFRRAIDLDPDMTAAYESLGAALASSGRMPEAIQVFHQGLAIDPLSATLNFDLGLALKAQGDAEGSNRALTLAGKLDPQIVARLKAK